MKYPLRENNKRRNVYAHINSKRMIRHINQTVFELLYDYHFDEMTVQKFVKLPRLIVVPFIVISKINMIYSIPYLNI